MSLRYEKNLVIPEGYQAELDLRETELAIKQIKDRVEAQIADTLILQEFLRRCLCAERPA